MTHLRRALLRLSLPFALSTPPVRTQAPSRLQLLQLFLAWSKLLLLRLARTQRRRPPQHLGCRKSHAVSLRCAVCRNPFLRLFPKRTPSPLPALMVCATDTSNKPLARQFPAQQCCFLYSAGLLSSALSGLRPCRRRTATCLNRHAYMPLLTVARSVRLPSAAPSADLFLLFSFMRTAPNSGSLWRQ